MLDPEPAVARAVRGGDAVVDVEHDGVGPVADGVHGHLQAGRIGAADPARERVAGRGEEAGALRVVEVGPLEQRRGGAEGAVHVGLHAGHAEHVVPRAVDAQRLGRGAPVLHRHVDAHAGGEVTGGVGAAEGGHLVPTGRDAADGGDALRRGPAHGAGERRVHLLGAGRGHGTVHRAHRLVLEHAGGLAGEVAHDDAAGDVAGLGGDPGGPERARSWPAPCGRRAGSRRRGCPGSPSRSSCARAAARPPSSRDPSRRR